MGARIPVWLPLLIAVISFVTSTYTFVATNAAPDLALTMPTFVRVAQGPNLGGLAVIYLQPSFTNVGQSARVEVISAMTVRVQPVAGGAPVEFTWREIDRFVSDPLNGNRLTYQYVGDAQPLVASRQVNTTPLQRTIQITLAASDIAALNDKGGGAFVRSDAAQVG